MIISDMGRVTRRVNIQGIDEKKESSEEMASLRPQ